MRIALVTHNVIRGDGQGRANYEIARHAVAKGHEVTLFSDRVDPLLVDEGVKWVPVHSRLKKIGLLQIIEAALLADQQLRKRRGQYDIVHGYGYTSSQVTDLCTAQFVHSAWLQNPAHTGRVQHNAYGRYQWLYTSLNARWEKGCFARARRVSAVSRGVRGELEAIGVPHDKIEIIPNGVDLTEFKPGRTERSEWGLPDAVPLALFAGDIRLPRKNLDTVLKALVKVPGVHLAVVGEVSRSPYPAMAAQLGLTERVHFLGFRKDVARIMQAVDVFVFPSRYEPFGMVVSEAMATGIPVITAVTTGASEIMTPDCGVVLPFSDDVDGLAVALQDLTANPARARIMGEAAHRRASEYSWPSIAAKYLELYQTLAR